MANLPLPIQKIIAQLRKFPGVGAKTAERYAFQLLTWDSTSLNQLADAFRSLLQEIRSCPSCFCLTSTSSCDFCDLTKRDSSILCIVSSAKDIYPIEETRIFQGLYHVLGKTLSPLRGCHAEDIDLQKIQDRVVSLGVKDIVLALDSTIEGDATALFLKEEMAHWNVSVSRLAFGIPLGSSLDYVDPGTLTRAFLGRQQF